MRKTTARGGASRRWDDSGQLKRICKRGSMRTGCSKGKTNARPRPSTDSGEFAILTGGDGGTGEALEEHGGGGERT